MQNALYNNKSVLAIDITYPNVENFKNLSKSASLKCPCCKETVILKYGDKKIPHFAHKEINKECILSNQKKELMKLIDEAQRDFIMKIRDTFKNEYIEINLNTVKDNELVHIQVVFENKKPLNIRFIESVKDKLLKDCINIIVYNSEKDEITKEDIFKYLIKYNIHSRTFLRGYYDMTAKKINKYFCKIEDLIITHLAIDYKNFKLQTTKHPNLTQYILDNLEIGKTKKEVLIKFENRLAFYLRLLKGNQEVILKYRNETADVFANYDELYNELKKQLPKKYFDKIFNKSESNEYLPLK